MKKLSYLFAGAIIGAAVTLTTSVYGAEIASLIGKKVQGETDIVVAGVPIEKAIIIEGKSYAPVRSVAELGGLKVEFKDKRVVLSNSSDTKEQSEVGIEESSAPVQLQPTPAAQTNNSPTMSLEALEEKILDTKRDIRIRQIKMDGNVAIDPDDEKILKELQDKLADLEEQKAILEKE